MSALNGLKLSSARKPTHIPLVVLRRNKLSNKLWEQIQLVKGQIESKPFVVTKYKSAIDKQTGIRRQVEIPKRIREWWFKNEQGKVCVAIRYGSQVIELAKGKTSVEVDNAVALMKALEQIKSAVEAGELDTQIETASQLLKKGFTK